MRILVATFSIAAGLLASVSAAPAQAQLSNQAAEPSDRIAITSGGPVTRPGASNNVDTGIVPEFQIASIDEQVVGEFALTWSKGDVKVTPIKGTDGQTRVDFRRQDFSLKASVPFNSTDADNPFVNFSNIGNDGQIALEFVSTSGHDETGKVRYANLQLIVQQCLVEVGQQWLEERRPSANERDRSAVAEILQAYRTGLDSLQPPIGTSDVVEFIDGQPSIIQNQFWQDHKNSCRTTANGPIKNQDDLIDRYGSRALGQLAYADLRKRGTISLWGVSATAGYQQFGILDRSAFRVDTVDRVGFEIEGFVGAIASNGNISGRLTAAFVRSFEAQEEVEFCSDVSGETLECLNGPSLLPQRSDSFVLRAEGRLVLNRDQYGRPNLAMAPEISYDTNEDEWLFDLPIYLQRSEENGLDAGIRLAYGTKDSDFGAGLFVGVPFAGLF